jgi:hypothetical protein
MYLKERGNVKDYLSAIYLTPFVTDIVRIKYSIDPSDIHDSIRRKSPHVAMTIPLRPVSSTMHIPST